MDEKLEMELDLRTKFAKLIADHRGHVHHLKRENKIVLTDLTRTIGEVEDGKFY